MLNRPQRSLMNGYSSRGSKNPSRVLQKMKGLHQTVALRWTLLFQLHASVLSITERVFWVFRKYNNSLLQRIWEFFFFQPFQTPFTKFSKVIEMNISDTSRVNNAHIWWHTTILAPTMGAASQLMTAKRINYSDNQTFFPFKTKLETQF